MKYEVLSNLNLQFIVEGNLSIVKHNRDKSSGNLHTPCVNLCREFISLNGVIYMSMEASIYSHNSEQDFGFKLSEFKKCLDVLSGHHPSSREPIKIS